MSLNISIDMRQDMLRQSFPRLPGYIQLTNNKHTRQQEMRTMHHPPLLCTYLALAVLHSKNAAQIRYRDYSQCSHLYSYIVFAHP